MNETALVADGRNEGLFHPMPMATMVSQDGSAPNYIPQATTLIRGVLEQITANDAPIGNEMNNRMKVMQHLSKVSVLTNAVNNPSANVNEEEIQRTTTLDTDMTEINPVTNNNGLNAPYDHQRSLTKLGHTSLASLCFSTLQEVDPMSSNGFHEKPETPIVDTNHTGSVSPTKKNPSPRKRNKMFTMTRQKVNTDHRPVAEEKKEDDAFVPHPRLQLFGSEYARHLSSCQLAPIAVNKPVKSTRRKQFPRSRCMLLEESKPDYQTGALLDIVVTCNDDPPPPSYFRISQTASGGSAAFGGLHGMYLNVKKEALWDKAAQRPCVTALTLIFPDRQEFVPPGFCVVRLSSNGQPANLNQFHQGKERVYLCLRRSREGNPITGLLPLIPSLGESIPVGYTVIEHSPRNLAATFAAVTGEAMFLAYRQRLANLETLRPDPLIQTVVKAAQDVYFAQNRAFLMSYFATGGTTVESAIGRFHILDRSTHSLLSPSSIANRLNLIEMSRRKGVDENGNVLATPLTYARSDCGESDTGSNSSYASVDKELRRSIRNKAGGSLADFPIHEKANVQEMNDSISECSTALKECQDDEYKGGNLSSLLSSAISDSKLNGRLQEEDAEGRLCMEALSFIPQIESKGRNEGDSELLKIRIRLLTPVLTACYTRHGGAALLAVEGLTSLLTKTDFFQDDVNRCLEDTTGTDSRITLLDLCIQAVSDVATTGSHEAAFASCLEFVTHAVTFSQAQLNMRTIGYVLRLYLFVFYFDASIPRKQSAKCPPLSWRPFSMFHEQDFPMLYDPRNDCIKDGSYLPGGAPQAAVLALKELVSLSIERLGKISVAGLLVTKHEASNNQTSEGKLCDMNDAYSSLLDGVLSSLVDNSVDLVERANYTQLALHQIHRSGGSELFWHDMIYACGDGLFSKDKNLTEAGKDIFILLFAMLQQLVKVSSGKLRPSSESAELLPKDVASKLLSLELLLFFLEFWSDEQEAIRSMTNVNEGDAFQSIDTLMFAVRRTVTPCLLWNTRAGLENPQVFRRVIRIVSELWCSPIYRKNCKVELGILIDHFAAKILELGPQCLFKQNPGKEVNSLLPQQIELITEIKNWLSNDPKNVIELFLNYDTDITEEVTGQLHFLQGTRWQLFQRISAGLSGIAEQCGELIGNQILQNQAIILSLADKYNNAKSKILSTRDEAKRDAIDKADMREAARDLRKVSLDAIAEIVKNLAISAGAGSGNRLLKLLLSWSPTEVPISYETRFLSHADDIQEKRRALDGRVKVWGKTNVEDYVRPFAGTSSSTTASLETAFEIVRQKSLKKAVEYLIACNMLTPAPRDVANFLRFHKDKIDPIALGQFLGENGSGGSESEHWNSIRYIFIRAISFIGMNVDEGLRHFLTASGFKLPGEAQQIDRLLNTFAQCFFEDNAGDNQRCPFKDQDTVYLLVFAIIMLNTDLHKSDSTSRKPHKKMSKLEFTNNLRGATQSESVARDYLSIIYDSIEANPIQLHTISDADSFAKESQIQSLDNIWKNVAVADSLLRGLSVHNFRFATVDDLKECLECPDQQALAELTRSCVAKTWHHWHGALNTCLENAHLDPQGMEPAVDILLYALTATVCLNMPMERSAFLSQLVRLRAFEERRQGRWVSPPDNSHRKEQWYIELEEASAGGTEKKLWALETIYDWIQSLKAALRVDVRHKVEMTEAVAELNDADFLLQDPARSFIQSGNLMKKSGRTGRTTMYRFYLFSDVLLYASKDANGRYKIHEELPLHHMKIVDWFPPFQKNRKIMFEIHHPTKTFQVVCLSEDSRKSWVENIRASILLEMERKIVMEAARASASAETNSMKSVAVTSSRIIGKMIRSVNEWDDEYARVSRIAATQFRTTPGYAMKQQPPVDVGVFQQSLQRLDSALTSPSLAASLSPTEVQRRRRLIQHLQQTSMPNTESSIFGANASDSSYSQSNQQQSKMTMALRQQDDMIDQLAVGVSRLKHQTAVIGEEASMHVNLMNDMDTNLDATYNTIHDQTQRAASLREDQSLWRLQLIVAGLTVLLVLEIFLGLTP